MLYALSYVYNKNKVLNFNYFLIFCSRFAL